MPSEGIKNTSDLRKLLLETIEDVKNGKMDPKQARTIAALSGTILQSAKLDLDFLRFSASNKELDDTGTKVLNLISA